ncbi:unnamed protein product, partial [Phaeothamnion confervicola]
MSLSALRLIVTGGAGFIGSAVCRLVAGRPGWHVLNIDNLTYAGTLTSLASISGAPDYSFLQADICDSQAMTAAFRDFAPDAI